jgi:Concanavalin A-like lectin/glucanases superfamily/Glycoside hydrolase 123, N-terminal domain/Carbohydrate family 9 binding domain-like
MTRSFRLCLCIGLLLPAMAFAQDKPTFRASYDKSFQADEAVGKAKAKTVGEVTYEMLAQYLKKGVQGQAVVTGVHGEKDIKPIHYVYDAKDNIDIKSGSAAFWVKPIDWVGSDRQYHIFFEARGPKSWILVYKYFTSSELFFLYGDPTSKSWVVAKTNISKWDANTWQHVTCTWDSKNIALYVNGLPKKKLAIKTPLTTQPTTIAVGGLYPHKWKPTKGTSLIDEVAVYPKPLSEDAIYKLWLSHRPGNLSKTELGIGKNKTAPTVDGVIGDKEYAFSATGFFDLQGNYASRQARYSLSHDDNALYIGVVSPVGDGLRANENTRDGKLWRDDSIEIYLQPDLSKDTYYQFILNSKGAILDGKGKDKSWNIKSMRVKNKAVKGMWTLEAAFPFKSLGLPSPASGTKWGINVCRSYPTLKLYTCIAPNKKTMLGYSDISHFPTLTLYDSAPAFHLASIGAIDAGIFDMDIKVTAAPGDATPYALAAKLNTAGKRRIDIRKNPIAFRNGTFLLTEKKREIGSNGILSINMASTDGGKTLFRGRFVFANQKPFNVLRAHTTIAEQKTHLDIKFNRLIAKGESLNIRFVDKKGKVGLETTVVPKKLMDTTTVDIAPLKPGLYDLNITLGKGGAKAYTHTLEFRKPQSPPIWQGNGIGVIDKEVPAPWAPIKITKNTKSQVQADCWGRSHTFDKSLFPAQITTQGQTLLTRPITLELAETGGRRHSLTKQTVSLSEATPTRALLTSTANLGELKLSAKTTVEFDGFMWIDLKVTPTKGAVKCSSLVLDIPMTRAASTLVHSLNKGYNTRKKGSGLVPASGWLHNIFKKPILWVGNEDVGLQWFAETLANWKTRDESSSARIVTGKNGRTLRLMLIDHPVSIDAPFTLSFGLMATPVKAKMKDWRNFRIGKNYQVWFPYLKYFNYPHADYLHERYKEMVRWYAPMPKSYYHTLYGFTPYAPEWPYWADQWEKVPPARGSATKMGDAHWAMVHVCANSSSYVDYYLSLLATAVDQVPIKDIYFDHGVPRTCHNSGHGCGYKDMRGIVRDTYNIRGTRKLAQRIYVMFKKKRPNGLILSHMSEEPTMPVLSFVDVMVDGELYCMDVAKGKSYFDVFEPDMFRAQFMSRQWGPISAFIPQFGRATQLYRPEEKGYWKSPKAKKALNHFIGYHLAHDAKVYPGFGIDMTAVWKIEDRLDWGDDVQFIPYWSKDKPFSVVKPRGNKRIMVSAYLKAGKLMFVVLNDTDKDETIEVKLSGKLNPDGLIDTFAKTPVKSRNSVLTITVPRREFKILMK